MTVSNTGSLLLEALLRVDVLYPVVPLGNPRRDQISWADLQFHNMFYIHYLHVTTWTDEKLKVIKEIDHSVSKAWNLKRLFNWINCKWIVKYLLLFLNLKARNLLNNNISFNKALLLWTRTSAKKFTVTRHFIIIIILQTLIFSPYREHQVKMKLSNTKVAQLARGWNWNLKLRVAETKALAFKHYVI